MKDPRVKNLAKLLVHYCLEVRDGETIGVSGSELAQPLLVSIYEELLKCGAFPIVRMVPDELSEVLYKHGKKTHFSTLTPYQRAYARCVDKTIGIHAAVNTKNLTHADPSKSAVMARTAKPIHDVLRQKPWVLTLFPTLAFAQDAEMSFSEYEDFVYGATFADQSNPVAAWKKLARNQDKLIAKLKGADEIRIIAPGTDIKMSVKKRVFVNSDGHRNMPSGEIFTAPIETSAEGYIAYDFPVCRDGREIEGVRLVFRKGVVVEASAQKNEKYLVSMLDTDTGSRRIGELGIGTNTGIQKFTKTILFDEKIGGTIHLALGNSILGTGGMNKSALHWDMIKDLRRGGSMYVDGKLFQKNGQFV